jgi:hypothetical protein
MNARKCLRDRKRRRRRQQQWEAADWDLTLTIAWQEWRRFLRQGAQCDCLTREEFEAML